MLNTLSWTLFILFFVALGLWRAPRLTRSKDSSKRHPPPLVHRAGVAARPPAVESVPFVLTNLSQPLSAAQAWWTGPWAEGAERAALHWLAPFAPPSVLALASVQALPQLSPANPEPLFKLLRALIRQHRKEGKPCAALLQGLYGAAMLCSMREALVFDNGGVPALARFVGTEDLQGIRPNFAVHGYTHLRTLLKTDIKWLTQAFGEPLTHKSFHAAWPHVRENAITRQLTAQLAQANKFLSAIGAPPQSLSAWMDRRQSPLQRLASDLGRPLGAAWAATAQTFVVADLETTGLSRTQAEVLEFAAVKVDPTGKVLAEFSTLVRVQGAVPAAITELTGITKAMAHAKGQALPQGMQAFLQFIGDCPVFFHNAPFDQGFLEQAQQCTALAFTNPVHDTLALARSTWPRLRSHKLSALAQFVGAPLPSHRALADVRATLAVLLAARSDTFERASAPA